MSRPAYAYERFTRESMNEAGIPEGPRPGQPLPDFELATIGGSVRREDFHGKPFLIAFGSFT